MSEIRFCGDIGMFAIDRPLTTCKHRTAFCKKHCYNGKLYALYPAMHGKDARNEQYWQDLTGEQLQQELSRKQKQTKRFRFMVRGEVFSSMADIQKVRSLLLANPTTVFWIPTRAWRNGTYRQAIADLIMPLKNARVQASVDPSNTAREVTLLKGEGWSTMGFGWKTKEDMDAQLGTESKNCPKTHQGKKAACATCRARCFSPNRTDVFLDQH